MLNDGSGFKKVYLATGFTDLRRGIDGLAGLYVFSSSWILTIRIHYSYFVANAQIA
ncbi:iS66 family element Orf2 [[Clostridium] nexile CAG:348]|nr:iS66 family element Orf2 [[Clostridium] nexile CAG:348]